MRPLLNVMFLCVLSAGCATPMVPPLESPDGSTTMADAGDSLVDAGAPDASQPLPPFEFGDGGAHSYFESLQKHSSHHSSFSMRSQAELDEYVDGRPPSSLVTYDPGADAYPLRQDAAKITIEANQSSLGKQVRFPVGLTTGSVLITWDAWFGVEFQTQRDVVDTYKTFQITSGYSRAGLWFEFRSRFSMASLPNIAAVDVRTYGGAGSNTTMSTPLAPQLAPFSIRSNTWTRYWFLHEMHDGAPDTVSAWVADEQREAVQLFDRLYVDSEAAAGLREFWLEFNTSQDGRMGGPMVAYARNLVILTGVNDVTPLLIRPQAR